MRSILAGIGLITLVASIDASARDNGQWAQTDPAVRRWFQEQRVPPGNGNRSGYLCCSIADGEQVEEDIRDGHYWIRGGHFLEWTPVPDTLVIREPNKYGKPIVWFDGEEGWPEIRCYAPGAGT